MKSGESYPVGKITKASILPRCEIVGECWFWQGAMVGTHPMISIKRFVQPVRRIVYTERSGKRHLETDTYVYRSTCGNDRCVNHIERVTRSQTQHEAELRRASKRQEAKPVLAATPNNPWFGLG